MYTKKIAVCSQSIQKTEWTERRQIYELRSSKEELFA